MNPERTICCMVCGEPLGYVLKEGPLPKAICSNCKAFVYVAKEGKE